MSKKLEFEPLRDMVLLEERMPEKQAGLILPDRMSESTRQEYVEHYVLKVGPDTDDDFGEGDRVIVRPSANPVLLDRETRRFLLHAEDILAVVK